MNDSRLEKLEKLKILVKELLSEPNVKSTINSIEFAQCVVGKSTLITIKEIESSDSQIKIKAAVLQLIFSTYVQPEKDDKYAYYKIVVNNLNELEAELWFQEHLEYCNNVLQKVKEAGFFLKARECFGRKANQDNFGNILYYIKHKIAIKYKNFMGENPVFKLLLTDNNTEEIIDQSSNYDVKSNLNQEHLVWGGALKLLPEKTAKKVIEYCEAILKGAFAREDIYVQKCDSGDDVIFTVTIDSNDRYMKDTIKDIFGLESESNNEELSSDSNESSIKLTLLQVKRDGSGLVSAHTKIKQIFGSYRKKLVDTRITPLLKELYPGKNVDALSEYLIRYVSNTQEMNSCLMIFSKSEKIPSERKVVPKSLLCFLLIENDLRLLVQQVKELQKIIDSMPRENVGYETQFSQEGKYYLVMHFGKPLDVMLLEQLPQTPVWLRDLIKKQLQSDNPRYLNSISFKGIDQEKLKTLPLILAEYDEQKQQLEELRSNLEKICKPFRAESNIEFCSYFPLTIGPRESYVAKAMGLITEGKVELNIKDGTVTLDGIKLKELNTKARNTKGTIGSLFKQQEEIRSKLEGIVDTGQLQPTISISHVESRLFITCKVNIELYKIEEYIKSLPDTGLGIVTKSTNNRSGVTSIYFTSDNADNEKIVELIQKLSSVVAKAQHVVAALNTRLQCAGGVFELGKLTGTHVEISYGDDVEVTSKQDKSNSNLVTIEKCRVERGFWLGGSYNIKTLKIKHEEIESENFDILQHVNLVSQQDLEKIKKHFEQSIGRFGPRDVDIRSQYITGEDAIRFTIANRSSNKWLRAKKINKEDSIDIVHDRKSKSVIVTIPQHEITRYVNGSGGYITFWESSNNEIYTGLFCCLMFAVTVTPLTFLALHLSSKGKYSLMFYEGIFAACSVVLAMLFSYVFYSWLEGDFQSCQVTNVGYAQRGGVY